MGSERLGVRRNHSGATKAPANHRPGPAPSPDTNAVLALQRSIGNRAVAQLLTSSLEVTAADHPFEQQAELAARTAPATPSGSRQRSTTSAPAPDRRPSPLATDSGVALDPSVRDHVEPVVGSLDGVRVHSGEDADALTASLGAEALTHGSDVFVSREHYRAGTEEGARLLAHEATHATGAAAASGHIHLKRTKKHLDFIRIKKKDTHIAREVAFRALSAIGADKQAEKVMTNKQGEEYDTYGHWWIEAGSLADPQNLSSWQPHESYGWWPSQSVGLKETLKINTVAGALNKGGATDPHHGDSADTEYHPVLEVDDNADYKTVRDQVVGEVRSFAAGFSGSWNWRLAWGKNCHTFVDRLKKKLKLHHQGAKGWLLGEGVKAPVAPPMSYAEIRRLWASNLRGNGFGMLDAVIGMFSGHVKATDLVALTDVQKTELLSIINEGITDDFSLARPEDLNAALASAYGAEAKGVNLDLFSARHVAATGEKPTTAVNVANIDVDDFLDNLETKKVRTLVSDLVTDKGTIKAGTQVMVISVDDANPRKVRLDVAGRGYHWATGSNVAVAFGGF